MNCPSCLTAVPDGAVICDNCNAIVDATFLGDDITNDKPAEATRIKAVAPAADPQATKVKAAPAAPPPKPGKKPAPVLAPLDADDDEESTQSGRAKPTLDEVAAVPHDTAEAVDELVAKFKAAPKSERASLIGVALFLFSLTLPWRGEKDKGELIGLLAGGAPIGLLALVVVAAIVLRHHPSVRPFRDRVLQGSLAASLFAVLASVAYQQSTLQQVVLTVGAKRIKSAVVWPSFGVYVGIVAALVMLGGAVKTWLDRKSLND